MNFTELDIGGVFLLEPERHEDDRGYFARTYCERELEEQGLAVRAVQSSVSYNRRRGTLRGIHFQWPPSTETKLVRCSRGAIFDVVADLRPESETYGRTLTVELSDSNGWQLFLPAGIGHGFLTLQDDTEVSYTMSDFYVPGLDGGYRWDDPVLAVDWPFEPSVVSERDLELPPFDEDEHVRELDRRLRES